MKLLKLLYLLILTTLIISCEQKPLVDPDWQLVVNDLQFPEGPAWDGRQRLYVSNCYGGWIADISETAVDTLIIADNQEMKQTNGLTWSASGYLIACDFGLGTILQISNDGQINTIIDGFQNSPFNRPNDIISDQNKNLYFTDPRTYGVDQLDGRLFFYNMKESELLLVADSLAFPNGLAISPIDKKLYVCESAKNQIIRFLVSIDGTLQNRELFASLPGGDPDGIDFDIEGNLYIAHFGSGTLYVLAPSGEILEKVRTPGKKPSNLEFAGPDLKKLYLTEDETNAVYQTTVQIAGHRW